MKWNVHIEMPKLLQMGAQRVTAAPQQRPWYRIHLSTLWILAVVLGCLVFINIPGDRATPRCWSCYRRLTDDMQPLADPKFKLLVAKSLPS